MLEAINHHLVMLDRERAGREASPSAAVIDSQSVKTTESGGPQAARKLGGGGPISRGYKEEIEHWAWCIRNPAPENLPRCTPAVALGDAVIALTTNKAARAGARIEFDKAWFDVDDPATPEGEKPDLSRYPG